MSVWEEVPPIDTARREWEEDEAGWEEYLQNVFDSLKYWWRDLVLHDDDGYFAHPAGSAECLALGHKPSDWDEDGLHTTGWNDELLCDSTRYGTACTYCEGECSYERPPSLWSLPGVLSAVRSVA